MTSSRSGNAADARLSKELSISLSVVTYSRRGKEIHYNVRTGQAAFLPISIVTAANKVHPSGVGVFELLDGGESFNQFPGFLLSQAQFVEALQIQPKLRADAREMGEAQGRVTRDGALPIEDPGDAVGGHLELPRERGGVISRASSSSARCSPGWIAGSAMTILLVIVNYLDVQGPRRSLGPLEANPPLEGYFLVKEDICDPLIFHQMKS